MRVRRLLALLLAFFGTSAGAEGYQRIATLAPHLAELVHAAGAGHKLVGVSAYSDYPPEVARLPVVGSHGRANLEALYRLQPDLILAWRSGNWAPDVAELERRGFNVVTTEPASLLDVGSLIRLFGKLAGTSEAAEAAATDYERRIEALRKAYAGRREVSVFVEIWHEPLMTVNAGHLITEVMSLCGARNVFADAPTLTAVVSREQLYARQPAAVLTTAFLDDESMRAGWAGFGALRAVRDGALFRIDADLLTRLGPRLAEGAAQVCERVEALRNRLP
ncbi:MAG: cobalamin-binding protein [Pseudomonadota bacterium]|nr:MAG: cobalamin-binding protein [Pseudomonadota bacterium]